MATDIRLKKSSVAGRIPSTLDYGEVALNYQDGVLYYKNSSNAVQKIAGNSYLQFPHAGTITFAVTVDTKDATHRYNGVGSSSGYKIDGVFSPFLTLVPGRTYRFDQSDNSNSGHPLEFYYDAAKTAGYSTAVTTNGVAGQAGAYTEIAVTDATPTVLHYQCTAHGNMGNAVQTNSRTLTGFDTDDLAEGSNLYFTNARVTAVVDSAYIAARSSAGTDSATVLGLINQTYIQANQSYDATQLNSQNPSYYLDYNNFTNTPNVLDSANVVAIIDSSYVEARAPVSAITVQDEGSVLTTAAQTIVFAGAGVVATGNGAVKTITIPGGGGTGAGAASAVNQIKVDAFVGDSSTSTFALTEAPASGNENSVIVTINGVTQHTNSYSLSGANITLDSAPHTGDEIEMRVHSDVLAQNLWVSIDSDFITADADQVADIYTKTVYRTCKYIAQIQRDSDNKYHSEEILLTHNGTSVAMTTYAQLLLDSNLGTFDADITGSIVRLKFSPTYTNTNVRLRVLRSTA